MTAVVGKLLWQLAAPSNLLLLLLTTGSVMAALGWRLGRRLIAASAVLLVLIALFPIGNWARRPLETRFTLPEPPPAKVDGVIVLGGGVVTDVSAAWGQPVLGDPAERFTTLIELGNRWPNARLAFSGGVAPLTRSATTEAQVLRDFYRRMGFDVSRITFEDRSRTTYENALFARDVLKPAPGEVWLLVTSAVHMPRAIGSFRSAGFPVVPWPVDYRTVPDEPILTRILASERLLQLDDTAREWLGLAWYRLHGWTDTLFPGPLAR